jgi:serine/threonine-protein kinase RsbW
MAAFAMSPGPDPPPGAPVIDLVLADRLEDIARVADQVERIGLAHGLPSDVLHDLQVTLDEVLSNIVNHAYTDSQAHRIHVRVWIVPSQVVAEVIDDGRPFDPLSVPLAVEGSPRQRALTGGLGIYFVRRLVDDLHYERAGCTNRLVMRKALGATPRATDGDA